MGRVCGRGSYPNHGSPDFSRKLNNKKKTCPARLATAEAKKLPWPTTTNTTTTTTNSNNNRSVFVRGSLEESQCPLFAFCMLDSDSLLNGHLSCLAHTRTLLPGLTCKHFHIVVVCQVPITRPGQRGMEGREGQTRQGYLIDPVSL